MKIAIVGSGISGMTTAHLLSREHDLTLFEKNDYVGGHTHTIPVPQHGGPWNVDTGFIVFNHWTYPNFVRLMEQLGVAWQPSVMSFSVRCEQTGLEYGLESLSSIFAQPRNLVSPRFWRMLWEIYRFRREMSRLPAANGYDETLGAYLQARGYSDMFIDRFLIPMGAAIWSAEPEDFKNRFPLRTFVDFFTNHAFLNIRERPQWQVLQGGSHSYIAPMTAPYKDRIRLNAPVAAIRRLADGVEIATASGEVERFDQVVIAAHSDQALAMLEDASDVEREILGAIPYQPNTTILHTDASVLPRSRRAWASWNYRMPAGPGEQPVLLTYDMNILQSLNAPVEFLVSLNSDDAIAPDHVLGRYEYEHPILSPEAIAAQKRWDEINGVRNTWFCGAYWGYGFHEDGVRSALKVCGKFGLELNANA